MPLINLSEEYLKNSRPSIYERIRMYFELDLYWASSLLSIEEHFSQFPPGKKDRWSSQLSAYIVMRDLEIKRAWPDSFDEDDSVSLDGLDDGLVFPLFKIKDATIERVAYWMAGNSREYLKAKEEFGFNKESYVSIPKVFLQYRHNNNRGWLTVKSLDWDIERVCFYSLKNYLNSIFNEDNLTWSAC